MRGMGGFFSSVGSHPMLCSSDANRTGRFRTVERTNDGHRPYYILQKSQFSHARPHLPLRSVEKLIGKFQELERQEIYFALPNGQRHYN